MPNGLDVVREAMKDEGIIERPPGSNLGWEIERWQAEATAVYGYNYRGSAWCAIWLRSVYERAGMPIDNMLVHPFTGFICNRADALGGLYPKGLVPPGSFIISCSIHVGLVVRDRGNGLLDTIEGNSSHQVMRNVRYKSDWRIVVPPGIEGTKPALVVMRDMYGFDDLNMKPITYGPWQSKSARTRKMNEYREWAKKNRPDWWGPVPVSMRRSGREVYAFRVGPPGSYRYPWHRGGWISKPIREDWMNEYAREVGHRNFRTWRKRVPIPLASNEVTSDTTVT